MFVIKDLNTDTYYLKAPGRQGWYGDNIGQARIYQSEAAANRTIAQGGHHVTFPGNRALEVQPVGISPQ